MRESATVQRARQWLHVAPRRRAIARSIAPFRRARPRHCRRSPPTLHQFRFSHFNEKVRWVLDHKRIAASPAFLPARHAHPADAPPHRAEQLPVWCDGGHTHRRLGGDHRPSRAPASRAVAAARRSGRARYAPSRCSGGSTRRSARRCAPPPSPRSLADSRLHGGAVHRPHQPRSRAGSTAPAFP